MTHPILRKKPQNQAMNTHNKGWCLFFLHFSHLTFTKSYHQTDVSCFLYITPFIFAEILQSSCFPREGTQVQRGWVTCLKSQSWWVVAPRRVPLCQAFFVASGLPSETLTSPSLPGLPTSHSLLLSQSHSAAVTKIALFVSWVHY